MASPEVPEDVKCRAHRILVVEDHVPTAKAVEALLQATLVRCLPPGEDMTVATLHDAESALASMTHSLPGVVVMDISLPGMNGIEAARRLREMVPTLPVIIHSRSDTEVYRTMATAAGARAFVSKRDTARELPELIRRLLEERAAGPAAGSGCKDVS